MQSVLKEIIIHPQTKVYGNVSGLFPRTLVRGKMLLLHVIYTACISVDLSPRNS